MLCWLPIFVRLFGQYESTGSYALGHPFFFYIGGRPLIRLLLLFLLFAGASTATELPLIDLQAMVDQAKPGATLQLPSGRYRGPILINKPLTVNGGPGVIIDAGGIGTVVTIKADGARISNLHLTGSGSSHNNLDAGVLISGQFNIVKDIRMDDVLFGILVHQSRSGIIRRNTITSKDVDIAQRGDGLRVWYSFGNKISKNRLIRTRDVIVLDSGDNRFVDNIVEEGRYGLHVVNSDDIEIRGNQFRQNEAGIFVLKANGLKVLDNRIETTTDVTGVGIGLKESSSAEIKGNEVLDVSIGIALDLSPESHDLPNYVENNTVAYNAIGIRFLSGRGGNHLSNNTFYDNHIPVAVRNGGAATKNSWKNNRWSNYEGFDRDGNGIGDTPYELYAYADALWMDMPQTQFFMATPILSMLDFLERLAPFSEPRLLLRDEEPVTVDNALPGHAE